MSMADTIIKAVKVAKGAMGDLIRIGVYTRKGGKLYDTASGTYTSLPETENVEYVPDKFSFLETQGADYQQTDSKIIVFNPLGHLVITTEDQVTINGQTLEVHKSEPVNVGGFVPLWILTLRK